jgi:lantibiotic modifying enzyme
LTAKSEDRPDGRYLAIARGAGHWIMASEADPERALAHRPIEEQLNLYYGKAGTIPFFQELSQLTGEPGFSRFAELEADSICQRIAGVTDFGLYSGLAGIASALARMKSAYAGLSVSDSLDLAIGRIQDAVPTDFERISPHAANDLFSGIAGIGLALLYLAKLTGKSDLIQPARSAGDRLLSRGKKTACGQYWTFSETNRAHYPNFSHGTAGIGYFLAELYAATGEIRFRTGALEAGRYLLSIISEKRSSKWLIPHDDGAGAELFYLGWCHGPAGTGRFVYRLYQLTGEIAWLEILKRQAETIIASGIPEQPTPGCWNNAGRCCGTAGIGEFFLGLYRVFGEQSHFSFAQRLADHLVLTGETDASGTRWIQAENRAAPAAVAPQTGLMQGAAGIGLFLIHFETALRHKRAPARFPDEPDWGQAGNTGN